MDLVGERTLEVMKKAKWYNPWLLSFFAGHLGKEILDVGGGIGNFTKLLGTYGKVTSIDIQKKYYAKVKSSDKDFGYGDIEKGEYFFNNKLFDSIICLNVLEHIENDERALSNIYRLLKKDGSAIILVPAGKLLYSKYDKLLGHFRRYNCRELKEKAVKAGFKISEVRYLNWWGGLGWFVFLKVLKKSEFPEKEVGIFDILGKYFLWVEKYIKMPFGLSVLIILEK